MSGPKTFSLCSQHFCLDSYNQMCFVQSNEERDFKQPFICFVNSNEELDLKQLFICSDWERNTNQIPVKVGAQDSHFLTILATQFHTNKSHQTFPSTTNSYYNLCSIPI